MSRQGLLREPPVNRNVQQVTGKTASPSKMNRFGEVAAETAADCAAICCCCPAAVIDLLVLAVYKVPAGLFRKAKRRYRLKRKKKMQRGLLNQSQSLGTKEELEREAREFVEKGKISSDGDGNDNDHNGVDEGFEKKMWDHFYGTGFWRSTSQRNVEP